MNNIPDAPFNIMGLNLNSGMGNLIYNKTWAKSAKKVMDPTKQLRKRNMAIFETSCDESDSKLEQRIDDDKIELMCHSGVSDYLSLELGRYG